MIAALHDEWADVTHVATPFLIRAALAGSDAVAIDAEFDNPIYSLIGKPETAAIYGPGMRCYGRGLGSGGS
jgi:hypothetical protein